MNRLAGRECGAPRLGWFSPHADKGAPRHRRSMPARRGCASDPRHPLPCPWPICHADIVFRMAECEEKLGLQNFPDSADGRACCVCGGNGGDRSGRYLDLALVLIVKSLLCDKPTWERSNAR